MKSHRENGSEGFTLVEMLVVIFILALLAVIVVFAVGDTSKNAALSSCQSDVKTVETAVEASKAQTLAYVSPISSLVDGGYLRDAPDSTHYAVAVDSSGDVLVTPKGGTTTTIAPGTSTTAAQACTGVQ